MVASPVVLYQNWEGFDLEADSPLEHCPLKAAAHRGLCGGRGGTRHIISHLLSIADISLCSGAILGLSSNHLLHQSTN